MPLPLSTPTGYYLNQDNVLSVQGKPILVGGGTDGASVNISQQNGMKGNIEVLFPGLCGRGVMLIV